MARIVVTSDTQEQTHPGNDTLDWIWQEPAVWKMETFHRKVRNRVGCRVHNMDIETWHPKLPLNVPFFKLDAFLQQYIDINYSVQCFITI